MNSKIVSEKASGRETVLFDYVSRGMQPMSILLWFVLWWELLGFGKLRLGCRWYLPVLMFAAMESLGVIAEVLKPNSHETEKGFTKDIEENVEKVVTAIAILATIPAFFIGKGDVPIPTEFFSVIFVAAVTILGGTLAWFGAVTEDTQPIIARLIRQAKAESYRHSLTWTLAAIISLYDWILTNI